MNQVSLVGRLTKDPEVRQTPNQTSVCSFTIAVDGYRKDDPADFIRITVFGNQADNCGKYLGKGRQVAVSGRIKTGSYDGQDGKKVYTTDIIANSVQFIGGSGNNGGNGGNTAYAAPTNAPAPTDPEMDMMETASDIPF